MFSKRVSLILYVVFFFLASFFLIWFVEQPRIWLSIWFTLNLLIFLLFSRFKPGFMSQRLFNPLRKIDPQNLTNPFIESIFKNLEHYVMIMSPNGVITNVTGSWVELFQLDIKSENSVNKLLVAPTLWAAINQSIATEKSSQIEWEYKKRNFKSTLTPLIFDDVFFGVLVTATDETKALQIEKIQSDFLADISHEIKTPLAAIMGAAEILNQNVRKLNAKETKEFQAIIATESVRLQKLIHELTDLSKIGTQGFQTLIKTTFSLKTLIEEVMKSFQQELQIKNLSIALNIAKEEVIFADYDKFFSIFSNLVSNAIRYTEKGNITIGSQVQNQVLIIEVTDTGLGIEPQNLERIFDRFYRTETARTRNRGGTGLGLAITRAIIQAHQGTIHVTSELNKGTTFIITLPQPRLT